MTIKQLEKQLILHFFGNRKVKKDIYDAYRVTCPYHEYCTLRFDKHGFRCEHDGFYHGKKGFNIHGKRDLIELGRYVGVLKENEQIEENSYSINLF